MESRAPRRAFWSFRDLPLYAKGLAVVIIPLLWLLAVAVAFYVVQRENQSAQRWVSHTLEVRAEIQLAHTRVEEAETGVLGYLLTREPSWLEPYHRAQQNLPDVLNRLEAMVGDNPQQEARVRRMRALIAQHLENQQGLPLTVPAGPSLNAALASSKSALDTVRQMLNETLAQENRLLAGRQADAQTVWTRGYAVIVAGVLFAPVSAVLAMLLFTSAVARRIKALDKNAQRLAEGVPVVPMRSGDDEIGRLEQSLSDAASLLAAREGDLRRSGEKLEARVAERTRELARANLTLEAEVAERKRTEEELADLNRRLEAVINASPLAIIGLDFEGKVQGWSHAAEQIFGWSQEEVIGRKPPIVPEEELPQFHASLERSMRGEAETGRAVRRLRKDGTLADIRLWTAPLYGGSGELRGTIAILADIGEQRRLEQQLAQSQKMEAIGRLAGGVAHDFNNVITIVSGYGHMLLDGVKDDPDLREAAEEVLKAADRAAALAGQLLTFSRRQAIQPNVLDLNALVRDMERMLGRVIGEDIDLRVVTLPSAGSVLADAGQMEQVLMNLVVNARDAMPHGGTLTIETSSVTLDENYARVHVGVKPGAYAMLAVSDTGVGMDPDTRSHIFEPFFTTKERGKGTGLGLSTVYGIVKQHGGDIWVYSEPGKGTTFKIYLPQAAVASAGATDERDPPAASGSETVLLVEDEQGVRRLVRDILELYGYSVLEADSGEKALEMQASFEGRIDLLLTDVVMPKMTGRDLAEALELSRPETKVLYLSGYTDRVVVDRGVVAAGASFLQKPFSPEALARKIREVLDNHSQRA
jgi:two-component system cell cycle sensor histidine kinase/response regulator CckA